MILINLIIKNKLIAIYNMLKLSKFKEQIDKKLRLLNLVLLQKGPNKI
jgi:hypothetical protein